MKSLKNYKRIVSLVLSISIASSVLTPAFAQAGYFDKAKTFGKNVVKDFKEKPFKTVLKFAAPIIPILVGVSYFALRSKNTSPINLESVIPVNLTSALPVMENISPAIASVMPSVVSAAPAVTSLFAKTFAMISPYGKVALSGAKFGLKKAFGGSCLLTGIAVPLFILWQLVLKKKFNSFIGDKIEIVKQLNPFYKSKAEGQKKVEEKKEIVEQKNKEKTDLLTYLDDETVGFSDSGSLLPETMNKEEVVKVVGHNHKFEDVYLDQSICNFNDNFEISKAKGVKIEEDIENRVFNGEIKKEEIVLGNKKEAKLLFVYPVGGSETVEVEADNKEVENKALSKKFQEKRDRIEFSDWLLKKFGKTFVLNKFCAEEIARLIEEFEGSKKHTLAEKKKISDKLAIKKKFKRDFKQLDNIDKKNEFYYNFQRPLISSNEENETKLNDEAKKLGHEDDAIKAIISSKGVNIVEEVISREDKVEIVNEQQREKETKKRSVELAKLHNLSFGITNTMYYEMRRDEKIEKEKGDITKEVDDIFKKVTEKAKEAAYLKEFNLEDIKNKNERANRKKNLLEQLEEDKAKVEALKVTKSFWDYVPFAKKSAEVFSGISKFFSKEEVKENKKSKLTAKDKRLKKIYGSQWKQKQNKS